MTDIEFCPKCNNIICECSSLDDIADILEKNEENRSEDILDDIESSKSFIDDEILDSSSLVSITPEIIDAINKDLTDEKKCEVCGAIGDWFKHCAMYMCPTCRDKEMAATVKNAAFADQRVAKVKADGNKQAIVNKKEREQVEDIAKEFPIDHTIRFREEFFNAETPSIIERKERINADDSIERKHFELSKEIQTELLHLRNVLFDVKEFEVKIVSIQRHHQSYLNDLVHRLRDEEREKIKALDVKYQPAISIPKTRKAHKSKPKFDKVELRRLAAEIGVPEFTLQTICVAKGIQPVEAAKMLKGLQE